MKSQFILYVSPAMVAFNLIQRFGINGLTITENAAPVVMTLQTTNGMISSPEEVLSAEMLIAFFSRRHNFAVDFLIQKCPVNRRELLIQDSAVYLPRCHQQKCGGIFYSSLHWI